MKTNFRKTSIFVSTLVFLALSLGLAMPTHTAQAAGLWYVDPTGNDANDCLSPGTACLTIGGAIGKASPSDTVNVAAGTYNEQVNVPKSLTLLGSNANANPGLSGARPNSEATIAYNGTISGLGTGSTVVISADNVVVNGFTITNGSTATNQAGILMGGNYVGDTGNPADTATIEYNIVSGGNNSIYIWESKDNLIEGNRLVNANQTLLFVGDNDATGSPTRHPTGTAIIGNYLDKGGVGVLGNGIQLAQTGTPATTLDYSGTLITGNMITDTSVSSKLFRGIDTDSAYASAGSHIVIGGAGALANTISNATEGYGEIHLNAGSNIELRRNVINAGANRVVDAMNIAGLTVSGMEITSNGAIGGGATLVYLKLSSGVTVSDNIVNVANPAASGNAINIENATGTTLASGNQVSITGTLPTGGYFHGIRLDGASSTGTFSVTNNILSSTAGVADLTQISAALRMNLPAGITSLTTTGNQITGFRYYVLNTSPRSMDFTNNMLDGVLASSGSLAQQFGFDDKIVDAVDVGSYGLVRTKASNVYVTPNSFYSSTTTPNIQRGVDAASTSDTVNVAAGTYTLTADITLNKSITLSGPNTGTSPRAGGGGRVAEAIINGGAPGAFNGSSGYKFNLATGITSLTVTGFKFTNFDGNLFASSLVPVTNVTLQQDIFDTNNGSLFYKFDTSVATDFTITDNRLANQSMTGANTALFFLGNAANSNFDDNEVASVSNRELFNIYDHLTNTTFNRNTLTNTAGLASLYADQSGVVIDHNVLSNITIAGGAAIYVGTNNGHTITNLDITNNSLTNISGASGIIVACDTNGTASITNVLIEGNTINTSLYGITLDTLQNGTGTISGVTIQGNHLINNTFSPILVYSRSNSGGGLNSISNITIQNNTASLNAALYTSSFYLFDLRNVGGTNTFSGNTVTLSGTLPGSVDALRAIAIRGSRTGTINITNNTLNGSGILHNNAPTVFVTGIVILSKDSTVGNIPASAVINVSGNSINGFEDGVVVRDGVTPAYGGLTTGAQVTFSNNNLSGNSLFGIRSGASGETVNAINNWWGAASGPGVVGPGTGSKVTVNVTYAPWYVDAARTILSNVVPTTVYVDATYTDGSAGGHIFGYDAFATIQEGITAVAAGGTVHVSAGAYTEQVTITKSLDLIGAGKTTTTILAPAARTHTVTQGSTIHDYLLAAYAPSSTIDVRVQGFTFDLNGRNKTTGADRIDGVFFRDVKDSGGTTAGLFSSTIHNFAATPDYEAWGIAVYSDSLLTLGDNDVHDYTRDGILVIGGNISISNNSVTGSATPLNGINIQDVSAGAVTGNTVTGHTRSAPWAAGGIVLWTSSGVTVTGNHVNGNFYGIDLEDASHDITISGNELTGNIKRGISLSASNNNTVSGNTIAGPVSGTDDVAIGVASGSIGNMIGGTNLTAGNTITMATSGSANLYAIYLQGDAGAGNTIRYNTITGGQRAVQFDGPPGITGLTTVSNNMISGQGFGGITAYNNGNLVITNNTLTNAVRPLEFFGPVNLTISGNTINGSTYAGINLGVFSGTATISGNTLHGIVDNNGIWAQTSGTGLVITGNTIYGISSSVPFSGAGRGIQIDASADGANIDGNEIYNITGFAGIVVDTGATSVKINNNYIHNNDQGIVANEQTAEFNSNRIFNNRWGIDINSAGATTFVLRNNQIAGNNTHPADSYGLSAWNGAIADARNNWWGAVSGPGPVGPGAGDKVSTHVTYSPWCINVSCSAFASQGPAGEIIIAPGTSGVDIQAVIDAALPGDVIVLPAETITVPGGFFITHPGITIVLSPGTVIVPSSPCFTISADDTTITGGGTCTPTGGSSGIVVSAPVSNLVISGIIIDGTGQVTADGIAINSNVTNLHIVDNYIHDMDSDGIQYAVGVTVSGTHGVYGNRLVNNAGLGINNLSGTLYNAQYNWWGDANGPAGTNGDGVSTNVTYTPWCTNSACSGNVPARPSSFYGYIHISDGAPVAGNKVNAYVPGVTDPVASASVILDTDSGFLAYQIDVPGATPGSPKDGGTEGDMVTFENGTRVVATYEWHTGTNTLLNFHPPEAIPAATSGNEGSAITFSGSSIDWGGDIASYALDWNNDGTYETTGPTVSHIWTDNGSYTVRLIVTDAQGGEGRKTFGVTVNNVAPTATFNSPASVNEGSPINLSLTAPYDPSSNDTAAGFSYAFDCGSGGGYGSWSTTITSVVCPTTDKGSRTVKGEIKDKDGGTTEYAATVIINDVLPTSDAGGPYNGIAGQAVSITGLATCAAVDTCTYAWDLDGDLVYDDATTLSTSYAWNTIGDYTIGLHVTDSDGNVATDTASVHIAGATYPITLVPGWNLISFNLVPANTSPATVLANIAGKYDLVYAWDGTVGSNNWLKYAPGGVPYANNLTDLHETMGLWIHVTAVAPTTILNVVGSVPTTTNITLSAVGGGWNLVGFPSASGSLLTTPLPDALSSHGASVFSLVYAYHASDTNDPWKLFDHTPGIPGFANDLKFLSPGWGYWVNMSGADETWTVAY